MPARCCEVAGHEDRPATGLHTWGRYTEYAKGIPHQRASLCDDCAAELWSRIAGPVALGDEYYAVEAPPERKVA
jgi:hypothetical protein